LPRCFHLILSIIPAPGSNTALAQGGHPTRPVKFLIPYPAGGTNDVLARIVGDKLQAKWGQPVIVENRTGGSGNIGAAMVAQAEPDGYTTSMRTAQLDSCTAAKNTLFARL
jgi:tripartite-type tricarboxylate transporter receptor subunit TctC